MTLTHTTEETNMVVPNLHYDHSPGKRYCEELGMGWDFAFADRADGVAHEHGLTQEQWDVMVREYAWRIHTLFEPTNYTWPQRIHFAFAMAARFLNPFHKPFVKKD